MKLSSIVGTISLSVPSIVPYGILVYILQAVYFVRNGSLSVHISMWACLIVGFLIINYLRYRRMIDSTPVVGGVATSVGVLFVLMSVLSFVHVVAAVMI